MKVFHMPLLADYKTRRNAKFLLSENKYIVSHGNAGKYRRIRTARKNRTLIPRIPIAMRYLDAGFLGRGGWNDRKPGTKDCASPALAIPSDGR
jgi:hypothetical protein